MRFRTQFFGPNLDNQVSEVHYIPIQGWNEEP